MFAQLDLNVIIVNISNCVAHPFLPVLSEAQHDELELPTCLWVEVPDGFVDLGREVLDGQVGH